MATQISVLIFFDLSFTGRIGQPMLFVLTKHIPSVPYPFHALNSKFCYRKDSRGVQVKA